MLQYIKTIVCPVCGCTIITSEEVETERDCRGNYKFRTHSTGGHWESRKFACGYESVYLPSGMKEDVGHKCENDPDIIEAANKKRIALSQLRNCVDQLDLDKDVKSHIFSNLVSALSLY